MSKAELRVEYKQREEIVIRTRSEGYYITAMCYVYDGAAGGMQLQLDKIHRPKGMPKVLYIPGPDTLEAVRAAIDAMLQELDLLGVKEVQ